MADRIKVLPDSVANQIAAGEVVNNPSSVVKEMLENAVDAGARNVTVNFRDGGSALIQIIDDGHGMSPIDARLAFDRHATSKISQAEDIYSLATFGFRGEALASIASVAEVELRTRQQAEELGTKVEISGGRFVSQTPANTPSGSQFIVKNLFYNLPARKRFIGDAAKETRYILTEFQRVALVHPEVSFTLYNNDSLVSKLPASSLRQRVIGVIGGRIGKNLLDVKTDTSIVKIEGFAGRPESAKQSNREQFLFVNGRYFKSPYFHKAVVSAYEKLIQPKTQPSYFIYLTVDPEKVDVNVHPQKTEVKFEDGPDIWQIINAAVRESLAKSGAVPGMDFDIDDSVEIPVFRGGGAFRQPEIKGDPDFNPFTRYADQPAGRGSRADLSDFMDPHAEGRAYHPAADANGAYPQRAAEHDYREYDESVLEYISGTDATQSELDIAAESSQGGILPLGTKYFITVAEGTIVVNDIRRAFEAVLFDRYMTMLGNGSSASQQLLFPERIVMSIDDYSLLEEHLTDLNALGFDMSFADEHTVEVTGLPADLTSASPEQLIYDLIDVLRNEEPVDSGMKKQQLAAAMAYIGSLSKPRHMKPEEMQALREQLASCANHSYTPGGLPIMTSITEEELRKRMK